VADRVWRHGFNCNPPRVSPREAVEHRVVLRTERGLTYRFIEGGWRRKAPVHHLGRHTSPGYGFWALLEKYGTLTEVRGG
jgi:hypothetical protein